MPTEFSDAALQEADAAIKANQAYQPSKGEKVLNKIGAHHTHVYFIDAWRNRFFIRRE